MIDVTNLSKSYGAVEALKSVNFHMKAGEIVGLLGPNGAGKTTFIKILTGYLQPDEGTLLVDGMDVLEAPRQVQAEIGYLPETAPLYPELTVQAYLQMMADLRKIPEEQQRQHISEAVYATGLQDRLTWPISKLSKGFRQRVGLAQAILHKPRILVLDEPTVGLDPTQIVEIRHLIRRLSQNSTVLFSTHILSEVEALCDRAIILMGGEVKADARLSELAVTSDAVLVLTKAQPGISQALKALPGVKGVEPVQALENYPAFRVLGADGVDADLCPAIYELARERDWPLRELRRDVRTLETVFNEIATGGEVS